jgi:hypothetical protein
MEEALSNGKRVGSMDWFGRNVGGDSHDIGLLVMEE